MIFSFGNLVTVLVVLLVLVIYRQLDRNNRSLEKVKRFSDKITEGLNKSITEKTTQIKDLSIELDVNLKTGKEVLKRFRSLEQRLNERSGNIEGIKKRMDDYDQVLQELAGMTSKVEENLFRIKKESSFVDRVGKNIRTASEQLEKLDKDLGNLRQKQLEENRRNLQSLRVEVSKTVENQVQTMSKEVERSEFRVKDFSTYITRLESRRSQMERESIATLKKSYERFEMEAKANKTILVNQFVVSLKKNLSEADHKSKEFERSIDQSLQLAQSRLDEQQKRLEDTAKSGEALELEAFKNIKIRIDRNSNEALQASEAVKQTLDKTNSFSSELQAKLVQLQDETEAYKQDAVRRLDLSSDKLQAAVFKQIEHKLKSSEEAVHYRFQKLEQSNVDIKSMEENLKGLMRRISGKVKEDFKVFVRKLSEERKVEKQKAGQEFARVRDELNQIDQGLKDLKTQAYQNVSEQLQVFEDEFFADLKKRNLTMEEKVDQWQHGIDTRVQEIESNQVAERKTMEKRYSEELKTVLGQANRTSSDELARLSRRVEEFQLEIEDRLNISETSIGAFGSGLEESLSQIRQDSDALFQKELQTVKLSIDGSVLGIKRDMEGRIKELENNFNQSRSEMQVHFDKGKADIAAWQTRVEQGIKEVEASITDRISGLRIDQEGIIDALKEDSTRQKDELITRSIDERVALKDELQVVSERIDELENELIVKSDKALLQSRTELSSFQDDYRMRTTTLKSEMEAGLKDFRKRMSEAREKSEGMQQTVFGKINESYKLLKIDLDGIDKRVKIFTSQTRLFERADELKSSLTTSIEEMKRDIDKLQTQRKDFQVLQDQLSSTRKTVDEVNNRTNKILAERRHIENMDSDVKKLLSLSRDLDHKVETVYSSQDALQEIQSKIRELEDLERVTETRYERLEKKKAIIEDTTIGVDKNFQQLDTLDKGLTGLRQNIKEFSEDITGLRRDIEHLSVNKEKSDTVVRKLKDLDTILTDLDKRIKKMESAREWLARTETRFETIGERAQEQVRLLEGILKAQGKQSGPDTGAPPMDKRETVIKLAHLGWAPQEIARTTKISRGEVELILELAPKK